VYTPPMGGEGWRQDWGEGLGGVPLSHIVSSVSEGAAAAPAWSGVCCFVLLNRYWGMVTVPGSFLKAGDLGWPDPHPPP